MKKLFICAVILFSAAAFAAEEADSYLSPMPKNMTRAMVMAQKPRNAVCLEEKCWYVVDRAELYTLSAGERAELIPNLKFKLFATPNDPYFNLQWHLNNSEWQRAADYLPASKDSYTPVLAVIDTGMRRNHPDMPITGANIFLGGANGVRGFDIYGRRVNTPSDTEGHGTHVTGIMAAPTNNSTGIASVSYGIPLILSYNAGDLYMSQILASVDDIITEKRAGARIVAVNMSFGMDVYVSEMCEMVKRLGDNGIISVIAAGNSGDEGNPVMYPAACAYHEDWEKNNIVSVAATNKEKELSYYSSHGGWVDIAAPGGEVVLRGYNNLDLTGALCSLSHISSQQIYSPQFPTTYATCGSADYVYKQGTSMASPFVAGAIGGAYAIYNRDRATFNYEDLTYSVMLEMLYGTSNSNGKLGGKVIKNRQLNVLSLYRAAEECRKLAKSSGKACVAGDVADNPQNISSYTPLTPSTKSASGFGCSLAKGGGSLDVLLIALTAVLLLVRRRGAKKIVANS